MRRIRRLANLRYSGSPKEQQFVDTYVRAQLDVAVAHATDADWVRAWTRAQDYWERTVQEIADKDPSHDLEAAERRSRKLLFRSGKARLELMSHEVIDLREGTLAPSAGDAQDVGDQARGTSWVSTSGAGPDSLGSKSDESISPK